MAKDGVARVRNPRIGKRSFKIIEGDVLKERKGPGFDLRNHCTFICAKKRFKSMEWSAKAFKCIYRI